MDIDDYGILNYTERGREDLHYAIETDDEHMLLEWISTNSKDPNIIRAIESFFHYREVNG
jgi:hypothetical protein